jgi:hypothetical protein
MTYENDALSPTLSGEVMTMRKTSLVLTLLAFGLIGCADNHETDGGWSVGEQPPRTVSYDDPRVDASGGGPVGYDRFAFVINYPKTSFCISMLLGPFDESYRDVDAPDSLNLVNVRAHPAGCSSDGPTIDSSDVRGTIEFVQSPQEGRRATLSLDVEFPEAEGVPRTLRIEQSSIPVETGDD